MLLTDRNTMLENMKTARYEQVKLALQTPQWDNLEKLKE